jgi:hypothetical protein
MGASSFTALETGVTVVAVTAMKALLVGAAFEVGVAIGSAINAAIDEVLEDSCDCE